MVSINKKKYDILRDIFSRELNKKNLSIPDGSRWVNGKDHPRFGELIAMGLWSA